jgi:POT family proton-dependent oligopeptide transporter
VSTAEPTSTSTTSPAAPAIAAGARERQPPGIFLLFAVEMWERFSFYGMKGILALFVADAATGGLGWSEASASRLVGYYGFSAYSLPLLGGYVADRWLGTHRSVVIGGLIIAAGHFCLAVPSEAAFFLGLALVAIGTGFFKSNVSTMVGQLYRQGDPRRDSGFTIFYMGVNVGAFLGLLVVGYLAERRGWHWGFGCAGVGMLLGLGLYLLLRHRYLPGIGDLPNRKLTPPVEASAARASSKDERDRLIAMAVIFVFTIAFWMAFEQTSTSMNFFASQHTDRHVLGFLVPTAWFQSVNSAVLILTAPLFAALWTWLGRRGREPSAPAKMTAAMLLVGAGFVVMVIGARSSDSGHLVSPLWLVVAYSLHTFGELCLSPIGLSMVTKLAPLRLASLLMGAWFFATSISELLAGQLAALTDRVGRGEVFHLFGGQADFYFMFVVSSAVAAVGLAVLTPWLKRLMHGRTT